jgi:hypothetical protein
MDENTSTADAAPTEWLSVQDCRYRFPGGLRSEVGIRRLINIGIAGRKLPAVKVAGRVLIATKDLEAFLQATTKHF